MKSNDHRGGELGRALMLLGKKYFLLGAKVLESCPQRCHDPLFVLQLYVYFAGEKDRRAQDNGRSMIQSPCTWRHRLASRSSCGFPRCVAKGSGTYTDLPADPTHRAAFHEIGAGWLGNDPIGMTEIPLSLQN
ncbi:hypothetical protein Bbelb_320210 [Branchiostoma belcheri]|nr:hypothetical protein Bbelb_320210 [Branchiostoma belcheri]